jgi:hypothetical protein
VLAFETLSVNGNAQASVVRCGTRKTALHEFDATVEADKPARLDWRCWTSFTLSKE